MGDTQQAQREDSQTLPLSTPAPPELSLAAALQAIQVNAESVREAEQQLQEAISRQLHLVELQRTLEHRQLLDLTERGVAQQYTNNGLPVLAMLIHRCLLHWQSLHNPDHAAQALLEGLARAIGSHTDESHTTNHLPTCSPDADRTSLTHFAYWLCVTSVTLALLHPLVPHGLGSVNALDNSGRGGLIVGLDEEPPKDSAAKVAVGQFRNKLASFGGMLSAKRTQPQDTINQSSSPNGMQSSNQAADHTADAEKGDETRRSGSDFSSSRQGSCSSSMAGAGGEREGEYDAACHARAPLVFLRTLDQRMLAAYSSCYDTFKKNLAHILPDCIQQQAQPTSPTAEQQFRDENSSDAAEQQQQQQQQQGQQGSGTRMSEEQHADGRSKDAPPAWAALVELLQTGLQDLKGQRVPRILIKCLFKQILAFINAQLSNQLLLRPECCSASNAQYLLSGLRVLDEFILAGAPGSSAPDASMLKPLYPELRHFRQAVGFLICPRKGQLSLDDIATNLCPALNSQQIYRLCTTFHDDSSSGQDCMDLVSGELLEDLKNAVGLHSNGGLVVTFLVDDNHALVIAPQGSTVPEVLHVINRKELYGPLPLPAELDTEQCPRRVFAFLEKPVPLPLSMTEKQRK